MKQILSHSTLLTAASLVAIATGDEYTHQYKKGDRVDLWVNKVRHFCAVVSLKLKKMQRFLYVANRVDDICVHGWDCCRRCNCIP